MDPAAVALGALEGPRAVTDDGLAHSRLDITRVGARGRSYLQGLSATGALPANATDAQFEAWLREMVADASAAETEIRRSITASLLDFDPLLRAGLTTALDTALQAWKPVGGPVHLPEGSWHCLNRHLFDEAIDFAGGVILADPGAVVEFRQGPTTPSEVVHYGLFFQNCVDSGVVGGRWYFADDQPTPGSTSIRWAVVRMENCTRPRFWPTDCGRSAAYAFFATNIVDPDWGGMLSESCNAFRCEYVEGGSGRFHIKDSDNRRPDGSVSNLSMHVSDAWNCVDFDLEVFMDGASGKAPPTASDFLSGMTGVHNDGCRFKVRSRGFANSEADEADWLIMLPSSFPACGTCDFDVHIEGEHSLALEAFCDRGGNRAWVYADGQYIDCVGTGQQLALKVGGFQYPPNRFARTASEGRASVVMACHLVRGPGVAIRLRRSGWLWDCVPIVEAPMNAALAIDDLGLQNADFGSGYVQTQPHDETVNLIAIRPGRGIALANGSNIVIGPLTEVQGAGWSGTNGSTRSGLYHVSNQNDPDGSAESIDLVRVQHPAEFSDPWAWRMLENALSIKPGPAAEILPRRRMGTHQVRASLIRGNALNLGERVFITGALQGGYDALLQGIDRTEPETAIAVYEALQPLPFPVTYDPALGAVTAASDMRPWISADVTKIYSPLGCSAYVDSFSGDGKTGYLVDDGPLTAGLGERYTGTLWTVLAEPPAFAPAGMTRLAGTVAVSSNGTVTGTGTAFEDDLIGAVWCRVTRNGWMGVDGALILGVDGEPIPLVGGVSVWRRVGNVSGDETARFLNLDDNLAIGAGAIIERQTFDAYSWGAMRVGIDLDSPLIEKAQVLNPVVYGGWGGRVEAGQTSLSRAIVSISRSGGTVTAVLAPSLQETGATAGDAITIAAMPDENARGFEGDFTLASVSADGRTVTWAQAGADATDDAGTFQIPNRPDFTRLIDENSFQMETTARFTGTSTADAWVRMPALLQLLGGSVRILTTLTGADAVKLECQAQGSGAVIGSVLCLTGAAAGDTDNGGFSQGGVVGQDWRLRLTAMSGGSPVSVTGEARVAMHIRLNRPQIPFARPV